MGLTLAETRSSGGFRALLLERGEPPAADAVRTLVPVSVRNGHDDSKVVNRISLMLPVLPVDVAHPVRRLVAVHQRVNTLKANNEAGAGAAITSLARYEPFAPLAWAIRLVARLPQRQVVAVTTNVMGPRRPLSAMGPEVLEVLPYVPIALRMRTGVAVLTYQGQLVFGVTTDYDSAPEDWFLARAIGDAVAELIAASPPATADRAQRRPRGVRTPGTPAGRRSRTRATPAP